MPSVFIEATSTEGWTPAQYQTAEVFWPILNEYLTKQMRKQPACDRFYDAQQAVIKVRHIDLSEWQTAVRIPVLEGLGFKFEGPRREFMVRALYHLLGAPTCLYMTFPAARPHSPALVRGIENETRQLVEYLVTLGVTQPDLHGLLELCQKL